jgi:DNA-binding beta-propeller fold protein YncE
MNIALKTSTLLLIGLVSFPVFARPLFTIVASPKTVRVTQGKSKQGLFNVTNSTGVTASRLTYQLSAVNVAKIPASTTCTDTLGAGQSCVYAVNITGGDVQTAVPLTLNVCTYNTNCSMPANNDALLVTIALPNAYIANYSGDNVSVCTANSNGSYDTCTTTGTGLLGPVNVAINSTNTRAYVTNGGSGKVSLCTINQVSYTFDSCSYASSGVFGSPSGIALNSSDTIAYVTDRLGGPPYNVYSCPILGNGTFGACTAAPASTLPNPPEYAAINPAGTFLYVTGEEGVAGDISACPINPNGTLSACSSVLSGEEYEGITFNPSGSFAYIAYEAGEEGQILYCPVLSNGTFGACAAALSGLHDPSGIAISPSGQYAYINEEFTNTSYICKIAGNGTFNSCNAMTGFSFPEGIAIY